MQSSYNTGLFTGRIAFCIALRLAAGKAEVFYQLQSSLFYIYKNWSFEKSLFSEAQRFQVQLTAQLYHTGMAEASHIQ